MTVREVFNTVLPAIGKTQAEAAATIGWKPQQISQKMMRDSLRAADFLKIMEANGVEVLFRLKSTGEIVAVRLQGHGRRLKGMADRVKYDTAMCCALSNSFFADGTHEYDQNGEAQELYVDSDGRYILAEYHENDPSKDCIRSVPAAVAAAFIEKYGTEINKLKR